MPSNVENNTNKSRQKMVKVVSFRKCNGNFDQDIRVLERARARSREKPIQQFCCILL